MRNWIDKLTPQSPLGQKMLMLTVVVAVGVVAFCWGRRQQTVLGGPNEDPYSWMKGPGVIDKNTRVVAYLYENLAVSREELGEYLIARFGAERLEFMINRKIVEIECAKYKVGATDAEVEDRFRQDLRSFGATGLTPKEFEANVLRRFNKTLYEWKEDVIRPKIMMEKLVKDQVKVTEQDVKDGFEARFGPKVQCRMIVLQKDSYMVNQVWKKVKDGGPEEFLKEAAQQFVPNLAQTKGEAPPIHKHFGDKLIEDAAFRLREKEISDPLKMEDGTWVILMCEKHLPANLSVKYETVWLQVHKEVQDLKIAQRMPEVFAEMRKRANPRPMLENTVFHVTRVETPKGTSLSAFENVPRPLPPLTDVPPPVVTPVTAPGVNPSVLPNTAPQPVNIAPGLVLPKLDVPNEKK